MLNYSGKSLVADIGGLLGGIEDYKTERKEEANQEEAASLSSTIQSGGGDTKAFARLAQLDPQLAQYTQAALQQQDQQKIKALNDQALRSKAFFAPMEGIKDQSAMNSYLLNQAREVAAGPGSPEEKEAELDEIRDMMGMDFNQARMKAQRELILAGDTAAVTRFNAAPKDARTSQEKNFDASQANPAFGEFLTSQKKAGATNVNTTISNAEAKGLTEEQKALAKARVGKFDKIQASAQSAIDQNEQLSQLENMDIANGIAEPLKVQIARGFTALGANGDDLLGVDVANAQAFNAVSGKLLAEALAAQKGPQTDNDADRMMKTLPKISNENDANRFVISSMKAINERKIEQANFYENILDSEGTLREADKKWREFKRKTPMLSENLKNRETGLPMFFNDFFKQAQAKNPKASRGEIIKAWRTLNE